MKVRDSAIEQIAAEMAQYESEIQSMADEIAELRQENAALKAQLLREVATE